MYEYDLKNIKFENSSKKYLDLEPGEFVVLTTSLYVASIYLYFCVAEGEYRRCKNMEEVKKFRVLYRIEKVNQVVISSDNKIIRQKKTSGYILTS